MEEECCKPDCSVSTSASGEEVVAKWCSVANHIQDLHTHENLLFPRCLHQPLVDEQARQWLSQVSVVVH